MVHHQQEGEITGILFLVAGIITQQAMIELSLENFLQIEGAGDRPTIILISILSFQIFE